MTELVAKLSLAEERAPTAATIAKTFKDGGAKALKVGTLTVGSAIKDTTNDAAQDCARAHACQACLSRIA